jgi:arylsulfatase A-like enzyme
LLDAKNQLANTLIIVSSDNGPVTWPVIEGRYPPGMEGNTPLRGLKGKIYEGGHRVPLLARWGDGTAGNSFITPGTTSEQLLGLNDLAATFLDLLGGQRPFGQANDSKSFLPALLATAPLVESVRDHLIIQGEHLIIPGSPPSAKRTNLLNRAFYRYDSEGALWKLTVAANSIDHTAELRWQELYNLTTDPGEATNLLASPEHQALVKSIQADYLRLIVQPQTITSFK